jgi:hypothetical protein
MVVTLLPMVTEVRDVHPENAEDHIVVILLEMMTEVSDEHERNAPFPR